MEIEFQREKINEELLTIKMSLFKYLYMVGIKMDTFQTMMKFLCRCS